MSKYSGHMPETTGNALQEHEVVLMLDAAEPLPREVLEAWTARAEDVLEAQAADLALGASAAANFASNSIEIDFVVAVESPAEIYDRVGRVMRILQEAGFRGEQPEAPPLRLSSSATHAVAVCA
jgi:hypothetical protein